MRSGTIFGPSGCPYDGTLYTLATTNFTNAGGDSYFMLADGQGTTRDLDATVMLSYLDSIGPVFDPSAFPLDRITKLP